jgi:hypothetical protein
VIEARWAGAAERMRGNRAIALRQKLPLQRIWCDTRKELIAASPAPHSRARTCNKKASIKIYAVLNQRLKALVTFFKLVGFRFARFMRLEALLLSIFAQCSCIYSDAQPNLLFLLVGWVEIHQPNICSQFFVGFALS